MSPAPGAFIGSCLGEVGHVLVPDPGRQWIDADQVQLLEVDRRLAVDAGVGRPERDLSGLWVDQPPVFVAALVGQRVGDLLQIEAAQVRHGARIDPSSHASAEGATRALGGKRVSSRVARLQLLARRLDSDAGIGSRQFVRGSLRWSR
jgi:hypothetical protein